jgi:dTDP-glucose 4,6-dehydratase
MNILVTGGAGFIGTNLVHYLLDEAERDLGCEINKVVNLDLLTYAGNAANLAAHGDDPRYLFVHGDICDRALVERTLREQRIDRVIHLAAESHVDRSIEGPEAFVRTNVLGTFTLLDVFRIHQNGRVHAGQPAFLHVSTDEVFGSLGAEDPPFNEATPYAPSSPYSASKAGGDHLARAYFHTYGMPVVTTNCSNNYGPYQFPEKLIPLMIRKTMQGEPLPVYGDGGNIRDWLYVRDHCRGLVLALLKGVLGETYVLGGRCEMRNVDLVRTLIGIVHELVPASAARPPSDLITFVKDRPGHDRRYAIDCSKAEAELGWRPQESFATGLRKTVRWYLENEPWIERIESGSYRGERLGMLV